MNNTNFAIKDESQITLKDITRGQWNSLIASLLGYALDIMDFIIYSMVIVQVMQEFGLNTALSGSIASAALVASAFGGLIFGFLADKFGRIRALSFSILVYSAATFVCGFSNGFIMLMICRVFIGLGMGGEYGTGAALVTEAWPAKYRSRVMSVVQSGFSIGYLLAAGLTALIVPLFGWRYLFFAGILPALLIYWIRRNTPESEMWKNQNDLLKTENKKFSAGAAIALMFSKQYLGKTIAVLLFITFIQIGYWSLSVWGPGFLALPVEQGGRGMSIIKTSMFIIIGQVGALPGYYIFGWLADKIGIKKTYVIYILGNVIAIPIFLLTTDLRLLYVVYPAIQFFSALYAGFGPILTEIYPTSIRATATGFIYNVARMMSGLMPGVIGVLALTYGLDRALLVSAAFWVFAFILIFLLPQIKGKALE